MKVYSTIHIYTYLNDEENTYDTNCASELMTVNYDSVLISTCIT